MSAYTQGKARIGTPSTVVAVGKREICECYADGKVQDGDDEANARRIVALWNACDGITTEHLEAGGVRAAMGLAAEAVDARKQAERLCGVLARATRNLIGMLEVTTGHNCSVYEVKRAMTEVRDALDKVKA